MLSNGTNKTETAKVDVFQLNCHCCMSIKSLCRLAQQCLQCIAKPMVNGKIGGVY